jgi:SAM-dependent methyltransferase
VTTETTPKAAGDPGLEFRRWLQRAHSPAHSRRTAAVNAAFFLPYLKPGMSLLDVGCGPGSITIGLAEAVAPGEVIGIDISPDAITAARRLAADRGVSNVRFEVADLHRSPFPPATFDAAFAHAVLQHVPDATRAVKHLRRMLKPGGILGVADADYTGSIMAPQTRALRKAVALMQKVRRHGGGDIHIGSKLRMTLAEAGLVDIVGTATAGARGTSVATRLDGEFWAAYYSSPELVAHVTAMGWATEAELSEASVAWRHWGEHPGAFWATLGCEAVGRAPTVG